MFTIYMRKTAVCGYYIDTSRALHRIHVATWNQYTRSNLLMLERHELIKQVAETLASIVCPGSVDLDRAPSMGQRYKFSYTVY
jgi:hypothetical protein